MTTQWRRRNWTIVLGLALGGWLAAAGCEQEAPTHVSPAAPSEDEFPEPVVTAAENEPSEDEAGDRIRPAEPVPAVRPEAEPLEATEPTADVEPPANAVLPAQTEPPSEADAEPNRRPDPNSEPEALEVPQNNTTPETSLAAPAAGEPVVPAEPLPEMSATERLAALSDSFREVARAASPSVVQVAVQVRPRARRRRLNPELPEEELEELRRRFGPLLERQPELQPFFHGRRPQQQEPPDYDRYNVPLPIGNASGWIYDDQGHVITSHHAVVQAEQITVTLRDGTEVEAELIGSDPPTDVAVLRIDAQNLTPAALAERHVEQGDIVLAIGSPFRYAFSVSQGIVSATERHVGILGPHGYENFIQTDTAINPGNSGGPLVNARGEVVGMCTAIASRSGAFAGLGFATPVDMIRDVADALIRDGIVKRGYLGTVISDNRELLATFGAEAGVLIEDLVEAGPADQAGLQPGDVIAAIDDEVVEAAAALRSRVARTEPGQSITITLLRDGQWGKVDVTLGQQPVEPEEPGAEDEPAPPEPEDAAEAEALAKLGFQRLLALTPEIAREHNLDTSRGILVLDVRRFSTAAIAGLRRGHVIVQVHGREVADIDALREAVEARDLAEGVRMRVQIPGGPARFVLLSLEP